MGNLIAFQWVPSILSIIQLQISQFQFSVAFQIGSQMTNVEMLTKKKPYKCCVCILTNTIRCKCAFRRGGKKREKHLDWRLAGTLESPSFFNYYSILSANFICRALKRLEPNKTLCNKNPTVWWNCGLLIKPSMFIPLYFLFFKIASKLHDWKLKDYLCRMVASFLRWPLLFNTPCLVKVKLVVAPHCGFWCTIENARRSTLVYKYFPDSVINTEKPNNHDEIYDFLQMYLWFPSHKGIHRRLSMFWKKKKRQDNLLCSSIFLFYFFYYSKSHNIPHLIATALILG